MYSKMRRYIIFLTIAGAVGSTPTMYSSAGTLDTTFNPLGAPSGTATTSIPGQISYSEAFAVALQSDGKIVLAGHVNNFTDFALARFDTNGAVDFAVSTAIPGAIGGAFATGVAIQPSDNFIVVAGIMDDGANSGIVVARYDTTGVLDPTFGGTGIVITQIVPLVNYEAWGVAIQPGDGKIVVAGTIDGELSWVRYNTDGTVDLVITTSIGNESGGSAVAIQSDGKILVTGFTEIDPVNGAPNNVFQCVTVRYNPDGSLDPSFEVPTASSGMVLTKIDISRARAVTVQASDGSILITGETNFKLPVTQDAALVVRYTSTGELEIAFKNDNFFGGAGIVTQSDNKIIIVGPAKVVGSALARYTPSGALDITFGGTGFVAAAIRAVAVVLQSNGKIVVAGSRGNDFAVARYNA